MEPKEQGAAAGDGPHTLAHHFLNSLHLARGAEAKASRKVIPGCALAGTQPHHLSYAVRVNSGGVLLNGGVPPIDPTGKLRSKRP